MRRTKRFQMSSCERCSCSGETRGVGALWPWCPRSPPAWQGRACSGPGGHAHGTEVVGMGWGWSLQPGQAGELQARSAWNGNSRILLQCKRGEAAAGSRQRRGARPGRAFTPCPPDPRTWSTLPRLQLGLSSKICVWGWVKLPQRFGCQNGAG